MTLENVLAYVLAHEKGTKIHQEYLKFPVYNPVQKPQRVKNEPTVNIVESNICRNCGQQFKKGHLTSCPARDRSCNTRGRKGHFAKHCRSAARTRINIVAQNSLPEPENYRANPQDNPEFEIDLEDFLVLAVDIDNQVKAVNDKIEGGVRTVFNHEGLELKKSLMVSLGKIKPSFTETRIDSASRVSVMKKDLLHELKKKRQISKDRSSRRVHEKSKSGLREYDKYHWKSYNEDSIKRMGCQGSTTVYH